MAIYTKTNTFSANTLIQSSQVNTNFNEISTAINTTLLAGMTQYGVLVGAGTSSAPAAIAPDSSTSKVLVSGGSSANPAWTDIAATQAEQETGSSTTKFVTPGRQQYHASACKGWALLDNSTGFGASYNASSNTDNGAGDHTVGWTVSMSSTAYCALASFYDQPAGDSTSTTFCINVHTIATGSTRVQTRRISDAARTDPSQGYFCAIFGDQ